MPAKSRGSAKGIERPFSAAILREAKQIADQYQVILCCEEKHWYGRGLELSNVFGDGTTVNRCMEETREALCGAVAVMLEQGQKPPTPARERMRNQQVNVRLTAEEKAMLETTAKQKGFKGLSDFIRAAALESVR